MHVTHKGIVSSKWELIIKEILFMIIWFFLAENQQTNLAIFLHLDVIT